MKNKEFFVKKIQEGSEIRKELNNVHHKRMNDITKIFSIVFNKDPNEFIYAKNILYYKGGFPSETTLPRAETLANNIANAYIILSYIGMSKELDHYLNKRGITISFNSNFTYVNYFKTIISDPDQNSKLKKALKLWKKLFNIPFEYEPQKIIRTLMNEACEEQKIICALADEIKIEKGTEVKNECEIMDVSNYTNLVNFQYTFNEGRNLSKKIKKADDKIKERTDCLNTYKSENK